jgi:hypothetical protein
VSEQAAEAPAEKKAKKPKEKKGKAEASGPATIALTRHPRALAAIARLRSTAALGAAGFVGLLSHTAGIPLDTCLLRGLVAGVVGYFVGWYVGVTVWRQLIRAELKVVFAQRAAQVAAEEAEANA